MHGLVAQIGRNKATLNKMNKKQSLKKPKCPYAPNIAITIFKLHW